jgi:CheY-like chemotaxis protein
MPVDDGHFDIVITDIDMPDVGGNGVADHMHNSERTCRLIAISGAPWKIREESLFEAVLVKPFVLKELQEAVFTDSGSP